MSTASFAPLTLALGWREVDSITTALLQRMHEAAYANLWPTETWKREIRLLHRLGEEVPDHIASDILIDHKGWPRKRGVHIEIVDGEVTFRPASFTAGGRKIIEEGEPV